MCLSPFFSSGSGDKSTAGNHSSLVQWSEVPQHPGIVCALTQTNNAVVLLVRPDVIQIHELKSLPAKSKIQGFVVVRQPTSPGESVSSKVIDIYIYIYIGYTMKRRGIQNLDHHGNRLFRFPERVA